MNNTTKTAEFLMRQARVARHERKMLKAMKAVPAHEANRILARAVRLQRWRWS